MTDETSPFTIMPPGWRRPWGRRPKPLDYSGPISFRRVPGSALPQDELAHLDDLAFDRTYRGQHEVMYGRRGRLVEARAGSVLGGYAFGLPLIGHDEPEPDWFIDTVAVAPALQGQRLGTRLVGRLALWLEAEGVQTVTATPLIGDDRARRESWLRTLGFHDGGHSLVAPTSTLTRWATD